MRPNLFKLILLLFVFSNIYSQSDNKNLVGIWAGNLPNPEGDEIPLLLKYDGVSYKLSIPSQTDEDLILSLKQINLEEFELSIYDISLTCKYQDDVIKVIYNQSSYTDNFEMSKISQNPLKIIRYQTNKGENFKTEFFKIEDDKSVIEIEYTYLNSNVKQPTMLLIEGSNFDSDLNGVYNGDIYGHNILLALSNFLVKNNYNTIRIVNITYKEQVAYSINDKIEQFERVLLFLNKRGLKKIVLIGHSEGGIVAELISNKQIIGKIILSSPVESTLNAISFQSLNSIKLNNHFPDKIKDGISSFYKDFFSELGKVNLEQNSSLIFELVKKELKDHKYYNLSEHNYNVLLNEALNEYLSSIYLGYYIKDKELKRVNRNKPTLYIFGEKDYLVDSGVNINYLQRINNPNITIKEFKSTSHNLQKCKKCTIEESIFISETINQEVLDGILNWLKNNSIN